MSGEVFHKAAKDGYLDLLREATRKECNKPDEDGMTPVLWAAYHGHLDALRMLVGRGGNPDKCDLYGNTSLHHAAVNGMLNCVTFLVSFGTNLWCLDNDFHTALDLAAIANHEDIVKYLDTVYIKQSRLNPKLVKKWKEKSVLEAQRRCKKYSKLQLKANKKAQKEDVKLAKTHNLTVNGLPISKSSASSSVNFGSVRSAKSSSTFSTLPGRSKNRNFSDPKPYSEHFTLTSQNRKYFIGGVAKKLKHRGGHEVHLSEDGDFIVREINDGKKSVRSLSGLRRDTQVLYVKGSNANGSISSNDSGHSPGNDDVFTPSYGRPYPDSISRALSEPEFYYPGDSGVDLSSSQDFTDSSSMFERRGFGSIAFMHHPVTTLQQTPYQDGPNENRTERPTVKQNSTLTTTNPTASPVVNHSDNHTRSHSYDQSAVLARKSRNLNRLSKKSTDDSLSIGTIGSLAVRIKDLSMQEEPALLEDDEFIDNSDQNSLEFFLAANGLSEYFTFFTRENIDLDAMMLLTDIDLENLGMKLGPRRKLLGAIARRKATLSTPGPLEETWL